MNITGGRGDRGFGGAESASPPERDAHHNGGVDVAANVAAVPDVVIQERAQHRERDVAQRDGEVKVQQRVDVAPRCKGDARKPQTRFFKFIEQVYLH